MIGMAFRVLSKFELAKNEKVMAVLTAPAAVANRPPANKVPTMICCLLGSWRRRMNGSGSSTMRKSVIVLMQPAASRCFCSSMHCCGVTDNVQYASIGLEGCQYMGFRCIVYCMYGYLPALKQSNEEEHDSIDSNNGCNNYHSVFVPTVIERNHPPHECQHAQLCQGRGKVKHKLRGEAVKQVQISTLSESNSASNRGIFYLACRLGVNSSMGTSQTCRPQWK